MKIHPAEAKLFCTDGWTDRHDKADSCFLQFDELFKNAFSL
jgi:hypothetical protein